METVTFRGQGCIPSWPGRHRGRGHRRGSVRWGKARHWQLCWLLNVNSNSLKRSPVKYGLIPHNTHSDTCTTEHEHTHTHTHTHTHAHTLSHTNTHTNFNATNSPRSYVSVDRNHYLFLNLHDTRGSSDYCNKSDGQPNIIHRFICRGAGGEITTPEFFFLPNDSLKALQQLKTDGKA